MIGVKFKIFVFHRVCFVSQQIWCQNSYPGSLALSRLRKPGWNFSNDPKANFITDQASSASRTHVKRPKVNWWVRHATHRCPEQDSTCRKTARQVPLQKWIGDRGLGWLPVMAGVGWQEKIKKISRLKTYWTYFSRLRQSLENSSATMCFASFPENRKQKFPHSLSQH